MDNFTFVLVNFDSEEHRQVLLHLLDSYASLPIGQGRPLDPQKKAQLWRSLNERKSWIYAFLGYLGTNPVAVAITMEGFSTFQCQPLLNIHDFYVSQAWQGKGIGKHFLSRILRHASAAGFAKVTLEVLSENIIAKNLYRSLGFSPYHNSVGGDAEFWQCMLADDMHQ